MLGHRQGIGPRHVGNKNAGLGCDLDRDHVQPGTVAQQGLQTSLAPHDVRRDRRANHDDLCPYAFRGDRRRCRR